MTIRDGLRKLRGRDGQEAVTKRDYTWEELKASCWDDDKPDGMLISIRDEVYSLSKDFMKYHPGGMSTLQLGEGRDCTILFECYHNTKGKTFEEFVKSRGFGDYVTKVGKLKTREFPMAPPMSKFYRTLKDRVDEKLKEAPADMRYTDFGMQTFRLGVILFFIFGGHYMSTMMPELPWYHCLLPCLVGGFFGAMLAFHTMHDCSHFCCTKYAQLNEYLGHFTFTFVNGHSLLTWQHQHTYGHHLFTNIFGADPDVSFDEIRMSWFADWIPAHKTQNFWAPAAYTLLSMLHRTEDITFFFKGNWDSIWARRLHPIDWILYFGLLACYFGWRLVLPVYMGTCSIWWALLMLWVSEQARSITAATCFLVSHIADSVHMADSKELMSKDGNFEMDWAKHQVLTTQDYCRDSSFWYWVTGGLNLQTVHHLLPGVSQMHYKFLQPTIVETCREFDIKYNHFDSFWEALCAHYGVLRVLGNTKEGRQSKLD